MHASARFAICLSLAFGGCSSDETVETSGDMDATFVGLPTCAECHPAESSAWTGSHHDLAMDHATEATVLGDFDDASFTKDGVTSKFFRDGARFMVRTDGADGSLQDFEVAYVFGVEPLQQYLVAFPGGRYQALTIAWDSRPQDVGGQRWFHLYPDERIPAGDVLHWTGRAMRWNIMCADCHSTNLLRSYDAESDSYATTWSEIDVSCEACHGPGSAHVEWARAGANGDDRRLATDLRNDGVWAFVEGEPTVARTEPVGARGEVETCAHCHSRRTSLRDGFAYGEPLLSTHRLALLDQGEEYWPDGQIRGEVYVYGSFLQSKMYHAGVTCSDCHDPHSLALRAPGNQLCVRCHQAGAFDVPAHHHHSSGSKGAQCVECHMPETHYMVVDPRRDHSIRIPRPDLSAQSGAPDACTRCHTDRSARWAAESIEGWRDGSPPQAAHWSSRSPTERAADASLPGIVRASAFAASSAAGASPGLLGAARAALGDPDPLVRFGAVQALAAEGDPGAAVALLDDPVLSVRVEAARVVAAVPAADMKPARRVAFRAALAEYVETLRTRADEPWSHFNLGLVYSQLGRPGDAEKSYLDAIRTEPRFALSYANLADLYRANERDDFGERILRQGIAAADDPAALNLSLGLLLVRSRRMDEALRVLEVAAQQQPDDPHPSYVFAVALESVGKIERAVTLLEQVAERFPLHQRVLEALAAYESKRGNASAARQWAARAAAAATRR